MGRICVVEACGTKYYPDCGLSFHSVFGKREPLPRFLIEDGVKPPIFGSYSYDPVKNIFEPPPPDDETATHTTGQGIEVPTTHESTVTGDATHTKASPPDSDLSLLRQKGTLKPGKSNLWWLRPKLVNGLIKNSTINTIKTFNTVNKNVLK